MIRRQGPGFSSVLGNGEYDRTALVGPDGALGLVIEGDVIVYNADCAALKTDCGNACVVVAQHSGRPGTLQVSPLSWDSER